MSNICTKRFFAQTVHTFCTWAFSMNFLVVFASQLYAASSLGETAHAARYK